MELDENQQRALDLVASGKNVFITGPAGTGKSHLLRALKRNLQTNGRKYQAMAPTGLAAKNIGGCTIHNFTGIGVINKVTDVGRMWSVSWSTHAHCFPPLPIYFSHAPNL